MGRKQRPRKSRYGWCKTYLTSLRSETTLGCWQLTGRLSKARNMPAYAAGFFEAATGFGPDARGRHFAASPRPGSGQSAVLGRDALDVPGDCIQARRGEICCQTRPEVNMIHVLQ